MTKLIGINGFKRTGKGTVADFLSESPDVGLVYQIGFSDKLKRLAASALGCAHLSPQEQISLMDTFKLKDNGLYLEGDDALLDRYISGRSFLQELGSRARELFGDSFWVDQVLPRSLMYADTAAGPGLVEAVAEQHAEALSAMYPDFDVVVITDLRFENEAQRIKDLGGIVWEIKRPGTASDGHASERPLPRALIDRTIFNEQGLDELRQKVDAAAKEDGLTC